MKTKHILASLLLVFLITNTSFTTAHQKIKFTHLDSKTKALGKINNPCIDWVCDGYFTYLGNKIYVWVDVETETVVEFCSSSLQPTTFHVASADSFTGSYGDAYVTNLYCAYYTVSYTGAVGF